jgi:nitrate/nitrite-specific signal transduction histidine kinase
MTQIELKQTKLKEQIRKLFKSEKSFAEQYYMSEKKCDDDEELKNYYEKFKKHVRRDTTKIEVIDAYLTFLYNSDEFRKNSQIKPQFYFGDELRDKFNQEMKKISKKITKSIQDTKEES